MIHLDRKELALLVAGIFFLLCMVGAQNFFVPSALQHQEAWAGLPWEEEACQIEDAGIAYRGSCKRDVSLTMVHYSDFAECMGPSEVGPTSEAKNPETIVKQWEHTEAGACAKRGDTSYRFHTGAPVNM